MLERQTLDSDSVFVVEDVLSVEECNTWIVESEKRGYVDAPITTPRGFVYRPDIRNNTRVIWDDAARAEALWQRVCELVPSPVGGMKSVGLNERFRLYRYEPGQRFAPHLDGHYQRENGEISRFTMLLYLNEGFEGGATRFLGATREEFLNVVPRMGLALFFRHHLLHEGRPIVSGMKYVLRTDVMYGVAT